MQCAQDFALLTQNEKIRDHFDEGFVKWSHSIIRYCKYTQQRMAAIQSEIEAYSDDLSEGEHSANLCMQACNTVFWEIFLVKKFHTHQRLRKLNTKYFQHSFYVIERELNYCTVQIFSNTKNILHEYFLT